MVLGFGKMETNEKQDMNSYVVHTTKVFVNHMRSCPHSLMKNEAIFILGWGGWTHLGYTHFFRH